MGTGAITQYVDVAQLVLYLFWAFFTGLIFYLVRENHREGYPMETVNGRGDITGWPVPKTSKIFKTAEHGDVVVPDLSKTERPIVAEPAHNWIGAPLVPTGNPMLDGVGPASWAQRADHPDIDYLGKPKLQPLRFLEEYDVSKKNRDPRGFPVIGADGVVAGKVVDLWLDISEALFRHLEVELADGSRRVILPINFARITRKEVKVAAILGSQFASVPAFKNETYLTMLEEEQIMAYYGGGTMYAEPSRSEPLI
jgi:photosynthetic reaction center H subunit